MSPLWLLIYDPLGLSEEDIEEVVGGHFERQSIGYSGFAASEVSQSGYAKQSIGFSGPVAQEIIQ